MKIAFFGLKSAFDYIQIGGTESYIRRLAHGLSEIGIAVDYILFGDSRNRVIRVSNNIYLRYFINIENAIEFVDSKYSDVVTIYVLPKDRFKFYRFRRKNKTTKFHFIFFSWPEPILKRLVYFYEAGLFKYSGKLLCISNRQCNVIKRYSKNYIRLQPPVPKEYFVFPKDKQKNERLKLTFVGRIDPGKGIYDVIKILNYFKNNKKYELAIYGIHVKSNKLAVDIHNNLKNQREIRYVDVGREKHSSAVELFVGKILWETDVFIQPYKKMSSTIDCPLLLLEAMASLCAVITKPMGEIPKIYGNSEFLISSKNFVAEAIKLLENLKFQSIILERERIFKQNRKNILSSNKIARNFVDYIK